MPNRNVSTGNQPQPKQAKRRVDPNAAEANLFNVGGDPINDRDALGRPLRSSLTDTDQSGTGKKDQWIGPYQGDHMRVGGPKKARPADQLTQAELDLKRSVELELGAEHRVDTSEVVVAVDGTDVILMGQVPERGMRNLAENIAQAVEGVTSVDNQLHVTPGERAENEPTDDEAT